MFAGDNVYAFDRLNFLCLYFCYFSNNIHAIRIHDARKLSDDISFLKIIEWKIIQAHKMIHAILINCNFYVMLNS